MNDGKMKYVYHGSHIKGLKKIFKKSGTHQKKWVYGALSKSIALIFISNKGSDLYYHLSGNGTKENPIVLVERKENMFKEIFDMSGSLYTLNAKNFVSGKTGWSAEVVSEFDEPVLNEEQIDNVLKEIIQLASKKEVVLYFYPDRPKNIPLDNSDLIPKVIKWKKRGVNIDKFFALYPELKDKFFKQLENEN